MRWVSILSEYARVPDGMLGPCYDTTPRRRSRAINRGASENHGHCPQIKEAFQDAYILANLLGHPSATKETLRVTLLAYEHVRLPFANKVIEGSRNAGAMYELRSPHRDNYSTLGPAIQNQWGWVEQEDPEAQLRRAIGWMKTEINTPLYTRL